LKLDDGSYDGVCSPSLTLVTQPAARQRSAPARRQLIRLAGALLGIGLLSGGCGTPAGGDPGGRRLKELSNDPVFAAVPPGATRVTTIRHPAVYREPGFTGGGWHGPSVVATFRTASPPRDVYRFYAQRAEAAGWKPIAGVGRLGLTYRWEKTYPDGAFATLVLSLLSRAPPEGVYILSGGIAPVIG